MAQPSPVLRWLLILATIGVYAVDASWVASEAFPAPAYAWIALDALTISVLSLVCLHSAFSPRRTFWLYAAPVVAVLMTTSLEAALANSPTSFWHRFGAFVPQYGLYVALLVAGLWLFQRTKFWRQRVAVEREWKFSLADLLIAMTAVAVLTAALRDSVFMGESGWVAFVMIAGCVGLTLACIAVWSLSIHWLLRLAAALGVAILLTAAFVPVVTALTGLMPEFGMLISLVWLIQAVVLSIWLGAGAILPVGDAARAGATASSKQP